jgi:hypothetical protein
MTYQRPRTGIYATVDGQEYEAEGLPENGVVTLVSRAAESSERFTRDEENGVWRAEVLTRECERLAEVVTHAQHKGHDCHVVSIGDDGSVGLYYDGPDKAQAEQDGFVQVDPGTWAKTVSVFELYTYTEHHRDLLFAEWVQGGYFAVDTTGG